MNRTAPTPRAVLRLCATCAPSDLAMSRVALKAAIEDAGLAAAVELAEQSCFNACEAPTALSLQGPGRATYFFTGVKPLQDVGDILATLRLYLAAPDGWIEDARPCGRLRHCLAGRVPAL